MKIPAESNLQIFSTSSTLHEVKSVKDAETTFRIYFSFNNLAVAKYNINLCKYTIFNEKNPQPKNNVLTPIASRNILYAPKKIQQQIVEFGEVDLTKFISNNSGMRSNVNKLTVITNSDSSTGKNVSINLNNDYETNNDRNNSFDMLDVLFRKQKDPANEFNKTINQISVKKIISGVNESKSNKVSDAIKSFAKSNEKKTTSKTLVTILNQSNETTDAYFDVILNKNDFSKKIVEISCPFHVISFNVDFENLFNINTLPTLPPNLSVIGAGTKRVINVTQVDKYAKFVEIFRKNISEIDQGFTKFSTLKLKKGESARLVDESAQINNFIYRAVSKNEKQKTSGNFSSCYVKGMKIHKLESPDSTTILATETGNGIKIKVFNIPDEVIALRILRKNLTLNEKNFSIVSGSVTEKQARQIGISLKTKTFNFFDEEVRPDSIYEYKLMLTDIYGNERLTSRNSIIEFIGKNYNEDNLSLSVKIESNSSTLSNLFTITVPDNESSLNNIFDALITAGYDSYYLDELKQDREKLNDLFAIEILRFDTVTGENESFGVQQSLQFSDSSFSKNKTNVSGLVNNRQYIYQFRLLVRSYSTIIKNSEMVKTDLETLKPYSVNMKKFASPKILKRGTLSSNALQKDAVYKSGYKLKSNANSSGEFLQGKTSITSEVVVTTPKVSTSITPMSVQQSAQGNVLSWKVKLGDQKIDHVIIYSDYNGNFSPVKAIHCFDKNESYYVDDKSNAPLKEIKYYLQLVYSDYSKGPITGPLKEI